VNLTHRPPLLSWISWYSLLEADLAPGHMDLSDATGKIPATPGIDPGTFRLVAQCLNHYATPGPFQLSADFKLFNVLARE